MMGAEGSTMDRRLFMASMAAAAAAADASSELAIDGGRPVRAEPLLSDHWAPMNYAAEELAQVSEVARSGASFRWYGRPGTPARLFLAPNGH